MVEDVGNGGGRRGGKNVNEEKMSERGYEVLD